MTPSIKKWELTRKFLQSSIKKVSSLFTQLTRSSLSADYIAWRQEFLAKRVRIGLWVALPCFFTFALRNAYDSIFPLQELARIPGDIKSIILLENLVTGVLILTFFILQRTWLRRYPAIVFLADSWAFTLVPQIIATLKGSPYPDVIAWQFVFLSQATLAPVCWRLHLFSQLVPISYYVVVNSALGFTTFMDRPLYSFSIFLHLFWYCFICNLGVYLYERLQQAEFESRRQLRIFLHSVTHDLKTPVMGTYLVLQNLLNKSSNGKVLVDNSVIERLLQGSDRQLTMLTALIEAHESEIKGITLNQTPIQLTQLVKSVLSDLEPVLTKNRVFLTNKVTEDFPLINADETQTWRVYSNIITNALKHNPPGISLTLNAEVIEPSKDSKSQISVPRQERGNEPKSKIKWVRCTVQDNGVGIPAKQCDRIFELYARGSRARYMPGLGLGLYLCKQIITAHGGEIGVISNPGEGSTFWFTLPIHIDPPNPLF